VIVALASDADGGNPQTIRQTFSFIDSVNAPIGSEETRKRVSGLRE
jgi:hypothetical protein